MADKSQAEESSTTSQYKVRRGREPKPSDKIKPPAPSVSEPQEEFKTEANPSDHKPTTTSLSSDGFNHEEYTNQQCRIINERHAREWKNLIMVPDKDEIGPLCRFSTYRWTAKTRGAFLTSGNFPNDMKLESGGIKIVFAEIKAWSTKFPGHSDDLGRTACFLRASHTENCPVAWVWQSIDGSKSSDGVNEFICFVPNEVLDTEHRRRINEEFIRSGKTEVNQLAINKNAYTMSSVQATMAPVWANLGR